MRFRIPDHDQDFSIPLDGEEHADASPANPSAMPPSSTPSASRASTTPAAPSSARSAPSADRGNAESPDPNSSPAISPVAEAAGEDAFDPLEEAGVLWYVRPPSGGRYGPADGGTVKQWIEEQRITSDTLLWREGWPQWRECREVLSEETLPAPAPAAPAPPAAPGGTPAARPGTDGYDPDSYLGAKKRRRAKRRITMIAVLVAVSLLLIVALIVALSWPEKPSDGESAGAISAIPTQ
jgi:hypothetical protein